MVASSHNAVMQLSSMLGGFFMRLRDRLLLSGSPRSTPFAGQSRRRTSPAVYVLDLRHIPSSTTCVGNPSVASQGRLCSDRPLLSVLGIGHAGQTTAFAFALFQRPPPSGSQRVDTCPMITQTKSNRCVRPSGIAMACIEIVAAWCALALGSPASMAVMGGGLNLITAEFDISWVVQLQDAGAIVAHDLTIWRECQAKSLLDLRDL